MTPEEKARAYDEALERASKLRFQNPFDTVSQMVEYIFPELKESEDERIRKAIITFFESEDDNTTYALVPKKDILAWLEKQGEQKPFDYETATIIQKDFAPKEVTCTQEVETGNRNIKALVTQKYPAESLGISPEKYNEIVNECIYGSDNEQVSSEKIGKNDTLYDLLQKMPSCITVDEIDYHFVMKKTIFYKAYYEGEGEEGKGKVIFMVTAYSPIDLLNEMLEKLKEKGLLE